MVYLHHTPGSSRLHSSLIAVVLVCIGLGGVTLAFSQTTSSNAQVVSADEAVNEALTRNLGLIASRYAVPIAEAGLITARLRPNPVLSIGADHLDLLGTGYNSTNAAGPPEYSVRTDFLFERGGKRNRRIEVATNQIEFARLQVLNAARELTLQVRRTFVDLQLAKESLLLAQQNLKALSEIIDVNSARVKAGDLAEVELVRTRVAALQYRNQVKQAELRVRAAKNELQLLLGRTALTPAFDIRGEFRSDPGPPSLIQAKEEAAQRRPDLLALRRDQARSQAELRLQIAQGKIDYTLGSEYRRQQGLAGTGNSLGIFMQTNIPIFNRNQGEIERVRREQKQMEARVLEVQASISVEVENAFEQYKTAQELLASIRTDMLDQAKDVREITAFSYRRGEASLIEFLDAQRAFNDTLQAYNEAQAEYARSLYALDSASGVAGSGQ